MNLSMTLKRVRLRQVRATLDATLNGLDKLEGEISKTFLALVKLEQERRRRSQYADTLKGALSPIRHFPSEILVEIFLACRDNSLKARNYSITDPRQAPMLMGQVSSRWRQVCHGTPGLWDHLHLSTTPGSPMKPPASLLPPILARSHALPLHVSLSIWSSSPAEAENLFDMIFQIHERWKDIHLSLSSKSLPRILNRRTLLPTLSSFKLDVDQGLDGPQVMAFINDAPQLRQLCLNAFCMFPNLSLSALVSAQLAQLTRLELRVAGMSFREARDILGQCVMIEDCLLRLLHTPDDLELQQCVYQLIHLRRLEIAAGDGLGIPSEFLEAFSFPNLVDLNIGGGQVSATGLTNLCVRSKFSLTHLTLDVELSTENLISFLRHLPALEILDLSYGCVEDVLFKAFTYGPEEPNPPFALPQLKRLHILADSDYLDGLIVADMVESVCTHPGSQNAAFPTLAHVRLVLGGPLFDAQVEDRLAAACATGFVDYDRDTLRSERSESLDAV
ncbi:hypothetical protein FB451DRAFT_506675 [Mycena latifolia]|nr:hypothetical protein FB451DRAFT_506675 [Mycena latifolia]